MSKNTTTNPVLLIDPGHGGADPGGGSNKLWKEKDFNLKVSLYQLDRFIELGIPTAITRRTDVTIGPTERAKIVRESGAKYCISNHVNAGGGEGAETIHSIYSKPTMARVILDEIVKAGQKERRMFVRTFPNDPTKDYYFMHRKTGSVETTIVEYGFADNQNDVQRLLENWTGYAESVVKAMCIFLGVKYSPPKQDTTATAIKISLHGIEKEVDGFKKDNKNYVPIRFLEELGYEVGWDSPNETVIINYRKDDSK